MNRTVPDHSNRRRRRRRLARLALAALPLAMLGVFLAGGGSVALFDRDEAWYCQASKQMVASGDYLVTRFLDDLRVAKPIFIYWCHAAAMHLLGETSARAARLPSAVAATLTLALIGFVLARLIGPRRALLTAFVYATTAMVIVSAKMCLTDSVLILFFTGAQLSLFAIYRQALRGEAPSWRWPLILWACVGLCALTKGPVALVILLATLVVLAIFDRGRVRISWWRRLRPLTGLPIVAAIVLPWLVAAYVREPAFIRAMLGEPGKHLSANQQGHFPIPGYYLLTAWGTFFPWCLLLPLTLLLAWRKRRALPHVRFALAAVIGNFVFAEIMRTKLPHYMMPSYLPLALLTMRAIVHLRRRWQRRTEPAGGRMILAVPAVIAAGVALVTSALPLAGALHFKDAPLPAAVAIAAMGALYVAAVGTLLVRRRASAPAVTLLGLGVPAYALAMFLAYLPHAQFLKLPQRVAAELRARGALADGDVRMAGFAEPSVAYYADGVPRAMRSREVAALPAEALPRWLVLTDRTYRRLPPGSVEEVVRLRGFNYNAPFGPVEVVVARRRAATATTSEAPSTQITP